MRAVVQRVNKAQLTVEDQPISTIGPGVLVFLGLEKGDTQKDLSYIVEKVLGLRIFPDADGKMNLAVGDVQGEILLVSQFTLLGDVRRGRRPGFDLAMAPPEAKEFFKLVVEQFRTRFPKTSTGVFGADMIISAENWGPVTILIDSRKTF